MTIREIMTMFGEAVPFPWSPEKICSYGYDPEWFLLSIHGYIDRAEDRDLPGVPEKLEHIAQLLDIARTLPE